MEADGLAATRAAIEAVWRIEAARLIGGLARFVRDLDQAEDLAQEAILSALEHWPRTGIPERPGAWLMAAAKNKALDEWRRRKMAEGKHALLAQGSPSQALPEQDGLEGDVKDDVLRLILATCHPVLSVEARVALTLRLVAGLTTAEIARAYLSNESSIAQRLVRAKRTLAEAKVPFEVPEGGELRQRLRPTLEVLYLIFNEGYSATAGEDWIRPGLCQEAMRLGRILTGLLPDEAEAHGLLALMELQGSRLQSRLGADGEPILLADQDRSRWDHLLIGHGLKALERAQALQAPLGPYALQAAIAACHARARRSQDTDWVRIVALYDALVELSGSPVVELNRAVAVSMAFGPAQALLLTEPLLLEPALAGYHLLYAVRGDLLIKLGRIAEAKIELQKAARLAGNAREKELLLKRIAQWPI